MARRQDENEFRIFSKEARPRFKELGFLALEGAASDDEPHAGGNRPQVARSFRFLRGVHVEFEISGDGNAIGQAAEREQAVGVSLALREHAAETSEKWTPE